MSVWSSVDSLSYPFVQINISPLKRLPDQVMAKDKRPGVAAAFAALYEDEEQVNWNTRFIH